MEDKFGSDSLWLWIVRKAAVTNPYKKYWSASVTLGSDINGIGDTIQKAYEDLYKQISESEYLFQKYANL